MSNIKGKAAFDKLIGSIAGLNDIEDCPLSKMQPSNNVSVKIVDGTFVASIKILDRDEEIKKPKV